MEKLLELIDSKLWFPYMCGLILFCGIFLTFKLRFFPIKKLFPAIKLSVQPSSGKGQISPLSSLMMSLATTIGTGNIAGVATALFFGGSGALVWMWISAFFGFSLKYAESLLGVKYRDKDSRGGPMYTIQKGMGNKLLSKLFCVFCIISSIGMGNMVQSHSVAQSISILPPYVTGIILAVAVTVCIAGGINSISKICNSLVPVMSGLYIIGCLAVIIIGFDNLGQGLSGMFEQAFDFKSILGGAGGMSISYGLSRGLFSSEAGLGSGAINAASAKTDSPVKQGLISSTTVFWDTVVICTLTAFAICAMSPLPGNGAALTVAAFSKALGSVGGIIVAVSLCLFAFSTIIGWYYYGQQCIEFLSPRKKYITIFKALYCVCVFLGSQFSLNAVWSFASISNALMAIPNLISLVALANIVKKETFKSKGNYPL